LTHTTFDAITDALAETTLSDEAGNSLGTAMDLVVRLERVNGAIQGAGGDLQFRAYVELTPDEFSTRASSSRASATTPAITRAIRSAIGCREEHRRCSSR